MASLSLYPQFKTNLMSNRKVIELVLQLKSAKAHGKNYIKVKPHLVRHLLRNRLFKALKEWTLIHVLEFFYQGAYYFQNSGNESLFIADTCTKICIWLVGWLQSYGSKKAPFCGKFALFNE